MSNDVELAKKNLKDDVLAIVVLNVGDGDSIIARFPTKYSADGKVTAAVIDCYNSGKTIAALKSLGVERLSFICATHPHYDHTAGILSLMKWCAKNNVEIEQFWDSGFRHVSKTHYNIIKYLRNNRHISCIQPTSGYETAINRVRVQVLSPSIHLKNRYDTFGTNINNASIVIKLEYPHKDIALPFLSEQDVSDEALSENEKIPQSTVMLGADAQFDAWAKITEEFPQLIRTENRLKMIDDEWRYKYKPLTCQVMKVPHHMSKNGISFEVLDKINPKYVIASCKNREDSQHDFPHDLTVMAVKELRDKKGEKDPASYIKYTGHDDENQRAGTVVAILREPAEGKKRPPKPLVYGLGDTVGKDAPL